MKPKKRLAQHFLTAKSVVRMLAEAADCEGKSVLEIGAGTGLVTRELAVRAKRVVAVELDKDLIPGLTDAVSDLKNVEVVHADALKTSFDYPVVVGNIPYNLSSPLMVKLLGSNFKHAALMVQKEFAERLVAKPNDSSYGRLSVMVQAGSEVEIVGFVPASCFTPEPKTDSALIVLDKKKRFAVDAKLVNALFQHKNQSVRKSLLNSRKFLGWDKAEASSFCAGLGALAARRVRTLSLAEVELVCKSFTRGS
ncbi:MAG: 16S rRNA (adenine(1518)-N(6)/adenine(1519)-N(6))-dimethyltransferase RsmA [Candidatus Micrarchaeota archaeon]